MDINFLIPLTGDVCTPSAGEYGCDREFDQNFAPKHSIGLPLPVKPSALTCQVRVTTLKLFSWWSITIVIVLQILPADSNPGPNRYRVQHHPTQSCPPSFSLAGRLPARSTSTDTEQPGPANYAPRTRPSSAISITPRRSNKTSKLKLTIICSYI